MGFNLSPLSPQNYSIEKVLFSNDKLFILTSCSLTTYKVEGDNLIMVAVDDNLGILPKSCVYPHNELILIDQGYNISYYNKKTSNKEIWTIADNQVLRYYNNYTASVFEIPKDNYIYNISWDSPACINVYSMDLYDEPILNCRRLKFSYPSAKIKTSDSFDIKFDKMISCVLPKDNWVITGSDILSFSSKNGDSHEFLQSRGARIISIGAYDDLIVFSRIDHSLCLLKWDTNNMGQFDHYQQVQSSTVFSNMVFYSSNRFLAYNKNHVPIIWSVENYKLIELGPLERSSLQMTGISYISTYEKKPIALAQTDGYNSRVIFEHDLSVEAFPNSYKRHCLGPISSLARHLLYQSEGDNHNSYEIRDFNANLITKFNFKSVLGKAGFTNDMKILEITSAYIVTERSLIFYTYSESHEIEIRKMWDYECYDIKFSQAAIYNNKCLGWINCGYYKEFARDLPFEKDSTITLNLLWDHQTSIKIGNLDKMLSFSEKDQYEKNFLYNGDKIGVMCSASFDQDSTYISEDFKIFTSDEQWPKSAPYDIVKIFKTEYCKLIAITKCNKLIVFDIENDIFIDLDKTYKWGKVFNVFPLRWWNYEPTTLFIETETGVYVLNASGGRYISDKINDVITNLIDLKQPMKLAVGESSIHRLCSFSGKAESFHFNQNVIDFMIKNENLNSYIGFVLHKPDKYSLRWFKVTKLGEMVHIESKNVESKSLIILDQDNSLISIDGQCQRIRMENELIIYETSSDSITSQFCEKVSSLYSCSLNQNQGTDFTLEVARFVNLTDNDVLDDDPSYEFDEQHFVIDKSYRAWSLCNNDYTSDEDSSGDEDMDDEDDENSEDDNVEEDN